MDGSGFLPRIQPLTHPDPCKSRQKCIDYNFPSISCISHCHWAIPFHNTNPTLTTKSSSHCNKRSLLNLLVWTAKGSSSTEIFGKNFLDLKQHPRLLWLSVKHVRFPNRWFHRIDEPSNHHRIFRPPCFQSQIICGQFRYFTYQMGKFPLSSITSFIHWTHSK